MSGGTARVQLLGMPVDLHEQAAHHMDTLRREFAFVDAGSSDSVPARLLALAAELTSRYADFAAARQEAFVLARQTGRATVDLDRHLPVEVVLDIERLVAMLDEADSFCRSGHLLTLVTPPEGIAYRRWFLDEITEQIRDGRTPRPWVDPNPTDTVAATAEHRVGPPTPADATDPAGRPHTTSDDIVVRVDGDLDLEQAGMLRNALVGHIDAGTNRLVLDMAGCEFVDSAGISLLLTAHNRCAVTGGSLRLVELQPMVTRTLTVSGVLDLLTTDG